MNPVARRLWLEALRDPKRQQGVGALRTLDGDCCLGVLCDVSGLGTWGPIEDDGAAYVAQCGGRTDTLPPTVVAWAGLTDDNPELRIGDQVLPAAEWNDNGKTFEEIADAIEEQL